MSNAVKSPFERIISFSGAYSTRGRLLLRARCLIGVLVGSSRATTADGMAAMPFRDRDLRIGEPTGMGATAPELASK